MFDFNVWINALTKPEETFRSEMKNASIGKGVINYVIAGLISGIIGFFFLAAFSAALLGTAGTGVASIFISPIVQGISALIIAGIMFVSAGFFGGKGSYSQLFYLASLYAVPVAILGWIPIVGWLVGIYSIYLLILVVKVSQNMEMGKAAIAVIVPIVILVILAAIAAVILGAALFAALGGANAFGL